MIPILEKWSLIAPSARERWNFFSPGDISSGVIVLNALDAYGIVLGRNRDMMAPVLSLFCEARVEKIFTEPAVLELLKDGNSDFTSCCPVTRVKHIYRLDPGQLAIPPDPRMRKARPDEAGVLEGWDAAFQEEEGTPVKRDFSSMIKRGTVYVLEEENRIVSMTRIPFAGSRLVKIAGCYTPVELRCKGFGTALQASVCGHFLDRDRSVISDPEEHNAASIAVKEKLGFRKIGREIAIYPDWDAFQERKRGTPGRTKVQKNHTCTGDDRQ